MKKFAFALLILFMFSEYSHATTYCAFRVYGVDSSNRRLGASYYNMLLGSLNHSVPGGDHSLCLETANVGQLVKQVCASDYYIFKDYSSTKTNRVDTGTIIFWSSINYGAVVRYNPYPFDCRFFR